ncbi:hypothetical protein PROFUN_01233 [Planoprotostelium fungivorum]|uniref:Gem-associated protein 2 n=1 Tax=Planoprotostelium fungivorum TaxID=1890364 RepID=A0A2P6NZJ6_9EUKA|nr:hypothetical protein PROFUN_01233 [Planoprotostelium fungivorum]
MRTIQTGEEEDKLYLEYAESDEDEAPRGCLPTWKKGDDQSDSESGFDYLRRVREEASVLPRIVVSKKIVQKTYETNRNRFHRLPESCPPPPPDFKVSQTWKEEMKSWFSSLRSSYEQACDQNQRAKRIKLDQVPHQNNIYAWSTFCFGEGGKAKKKEEAERVVTETITVTTIVEDEKVVQMDVAETTEIRTTDASNTDNSITEEGEEGEIVLEGEEKDGTEEKQKMETGEKVEETTQTQVVDNKEETKDKEKEKSEPIVLQSHRPLSSYLMNLNYNTVQDVLRHHIHWLNDTELTTERAVWLFALLTKLEVPLHPETQGSLQALLYKLCLMRSQLRSHDEEMAAPIIILIEIITEIFGQKESNTHRPE